MKKIISLFQRNYDGDHLVRGELVPGAEWVVAGDGIATRKFDGTCCLIRDGMLYKRFDAKRGKTPPPGFEPAQEPDPVTGHHPGWIPIGDGPDDKWHREAASIRVTFSGVLAGSFAETLPWVDGSYELVGPKVQGNPEAAVRHVLVKHGAYPLPDAPRTFDAIREYLQNHDYEGIVWHRSDGRLVKIKAKDFGLKRQRAPELVPA